MTGLGQLPVGGIGAGTPLVRPPMSRRPLASANTRVVAAPTMDKPTAGNKVTLHATPEQSRRAILEAIKGARESFLIEIFIWHDDESGREIADALIARKQEATARGEAFDAKVMVDWAGLHDASNPTKDNKLMDLMSAHGIAVREFNKGGLNPLANGYSPITHRKLFIADGQKFLSGGRNIGDEYLRPTFFSKDKSREFAWHDLMFTIEGAETTRITREFYKNWARTGGTVPATLPIARSAPGGKALVQSVVTDPLTNKQELREATRRAILNAKTEIRVAFPYLSDDAMIEALIQAKKANPALSIKVLMPGRSQKALNGFLYHHLNQISARQLLRAGIEVRQLECREMCKMKVKSFSHFKAMAFDGKLLSIGSGNGDNRTFTSNHELNCLIQDQPTAQKFIGELLQPDWELATPLSLAGLTAIPWWKRILQNVIELVDFLF